MQAGQFSISTEWQEDCRVLTVTGELDEGTAPELESELGDGDGLTVVDLSGLSFVSSAGLHVLLKPRPDGCPALVCPQGNVLRLLDIVEARRTTPVFPDLASAVMSVSLAGNGATSRGRRGRLLRRARS